jgi:hypothetical protein
VGVSTAPPAPSSVRQLPWNARRVGLWPTLTHVMPAASAARIQSSSNALSMALVLSSSSAKVGRWYSRRANPSRCCSPPLDHTAKQAIAVTRARHTVDTKASHRNHYLATASFPTPTPTPTRTHTPTSKCPASRDHSS